VDGCRASRRAGSAAPAWRGAAARQRAIGALKYTSFTIVIFFVFFMLGLFLSPAEIEPTEPEWYQQLFTDDSTARARRGRTGMAAGAHPEARARAFWTRMRDFRPQTLSAPCSS